MNDTKNNKDADDIDFVFYDVKQAYDSLDKNHTLLDLYKTGVENSALNILDELGSKASIKVKPPVGIGDDNEIDDTIMQGESISSILCSNSVDTIAKNCPLKPLKIKDSINIPQMSFVKDVMDATKY